MITIGDYHELCERYVDEYGRLYEKIWHEVNIEQTPGPFDQNLHFYELTYSKKDGTTSKRRIAGVVKVINNELHEIYIEKSSGKKITRKILGAMKNPTKLLIGISLIEDYLVPDVGELGEEVEKSRHFCGSLKIINNFLYPNNKELVDEWKDSQGFLRRRMI